jgi:hypothetical protein
MTTTKYKGLDPITNIRKQKGRVLFLDPTPFSPEVNSIYGHAISLRLIGTAVASQMQ